MPRHTYAALMLEAGESVVTLARRLGHSSPTITLGYYGHFMPEAGGRKQGANRHRRTARGAGRTACRPKLPRFSPGRLTGDSRCGASLAAFVDFKAEETGGLEKC